jgi:D-alanyl-D-alanine carboxypeptidase
MKAGNLILGRKENLKREIASLTKIMTLYTALDLCDRFRLNPDKI